MSVKQDTATQNPVKKKHRFTVPTAFTILFFLTVIAVFATWMVPAGSYSKLVYDKETSSFSVLQPNGEMQDLPGNQESLDKLNVQIDFGEFESGSITKPISIPETYQRLASNPLGIQEVPISMVHGTIEAIDVIAFILVLGGLIGVVKATGAFEAGLMRLTQRSKGKEFILVFAMSLFMIIGGTTCGLEEEAVAFYPIMVPIFIAMGYDSIISVGAIFLAGSMGTTMSTINPFSVVIASNAAGIVFTEGLWWRLAGCVVGGIVVIAYLYWYARKLKQNPEFSYTWEDHEKFNEQWSLSGEGEVIAFTWRRKVILFLFGASFVIMVWGVMSQGWWFPTMAAMFLTVALIVIFLAITGKNRLSEKQMVDAFNEGSASMVAVSLIIGLARGINRIMEQGLISDTMLYQASKLVEGMPGPLFVVMMMIIFFFLGFVVPSSSGLAVLSMPIMAPLADTVGVPRWIVVCAYQWGQYAMLYLAPTGLVMATLQMLDMKYSHWLRFVWPMVVFVLVFGGITLVIQSLVYGV